MNDLKAKRAAALQEKKRRLEELKARRSNRAAGKSGAPSAVSASKTGNLDEYIDSLLHSPPPGGVSVGAGAGASVVSGGASVATTASGTSMSMSVNDAGTETKTKSVGFVSKIDQMNQDQARMATTADVNQDPPQSPAKKVETFTMSTQTDENEFPMPLVENSEDETNEMQKSDTASGGDESMAHNDDQDKMGMTEDGGVALKEPVLLTEEEVMDTIYTSQPFSTFFNSASKKVERILGASLLSDLLVDDSVYYADKESKMMMDNASASSSTKDSLVSAKVSFSFPKWTANRTVTSLDWSPHHRGEVMLASYNMPSTSSSSSGPTSTSTALSSLSSKNDPSSSSLLPRSKREMTNADGLTILWNLAMPSRPEHIFTCGSPVLNAKFHPTEGSLVVGACYSGQVVVWDVRTNGRLPVQRSKLNILGGGNVSGGHVHPVVGMETLDAGFVTAASDGTVNIWSYSNLMEPAETVIVPGANISSLTVAPESGTIIVGDECGSMHAILPSTTSGGGTRSSSSKRSIIKLNGSSGAGAGAGADDQLSHFGNVTGISAKPSLKNDKNVGVVKGFARGAQGLILSTGVDWTTKLWAPAYTDKPLLSLLSHSYDYMSDVQWSPVHASIFATASSNGTLGLWNLASSLDEPMTGSQGLMIDTSDECHGVNKIKWSPDGRRIVAACSDTLYVLGMSDELWKPKGNEGTRLMNNLKGRGLLLEEEEDQ